LVQLRHRPFDCGVKWFGPGERVLHLARGQFGE
jgi:hypothetical protein